MKLAGGVAVTKQDVPTLQSSLISITATTPHNVLLRLEALPPAVTAEKPSEGQLCRWSGAGWFLRAWCVPLAIPLAAVGVVASSVVERHGIPSHHGPIPCVVGTLLRRPGQGLARPQRPLLGNDSQRLLRTQRSGATDPSWRELSSHPTRPSSLPPSPRRLFCCSSSVACALAMPNPTRLGRMCCCCSAVRLPARPVLAGRQCEAA